MSAGQVTDVEGNVIQYEEILSEFEKCLIDVTTHSGGLEVFRSEYESLILALQKSHESELKLRERTQELEGNIQSSKERVRKLKAEDEEMGSRRRRFESELEHNKKQMTELKKATVERKKKLSKLKDESEVVKGKLAKGSGWSDEQQEKFSLLESRRESMERELETKHINLKSVRQEVEVLSGNVEHAQQLHSNLEEEFSEVEQGVVDKRNEANRALHRKEKLDVQLKKLKSQLEEQQQFFLEREEQVSEGKGEIAELERKVHIARQQIEKYLREYDALFHSTNNVSEALENQARGNSEIRADLLSKEEAIGLKQQEVNVAKKQVLRIQKLSEHTRKKIAVVQAEIAAVVEERDLIKVKLKEANLRVDCRRREVDNTKKQIEDLSREREILSKSLIRTEDKSRMAQNLIRMQQNAKKNLENEIVGYKTEALRTRQAIEQLEIDVQRYDEEASVANQMYYTALEEVKLQELQIAELQKRILSGETKMKQQQNLYEAARSDRNLYSKNLIESQDEIAEMKRKFKIMNHQIEQLKEEITTKDHALVKEHFDHHKVEKEKETLKNELLKIKKQVLSSEHIISNQSIEIQKLSQIIVEADEEKLRQEKEYSAVVAERDILGSQLIRRNEELESLYEKLKIQMSTLSKGRMQYSNRVDRIKELKHQLRDIVKDFKLSSRQVVNMETLRREVFKLENELTQERSKVAAVQQELTKPLNVHRWRKLEGSDPERYKMIKKIQQLQRAIIAQTDLVLEKDAQIQAKEKLYVELKSILARQPGNEVAEQLAVYEANMKEKSSQMAFMENELHQYRGQVEELKHELTHLNKSMRGLKSKYFAMMEARFFESGNNDGMHSEGDKGNQKFLDDLQSTHHALTPNENTRPGSS